MRAWQRRTPGVERRGAVSLSGQRARHFLGGREAAFESQRGREGAFERETERQRDRETETETEMEGGSERMRCGAITGGSASVSPEGGREDTCRSRLAAAV